MGGLKSVDASFCGPHNIAAVVSAAQGIADMFPVFGDKVAELKQQGIAFLELPLRDSHTQVQITRERMR